MKRALTILTTTLAAAHLFSCAGSREKITWEDAVAPQKPAARAFDPRTLPGPDSRPGDCEAAARVYLEDSADSGWAALNVCAQRPNFTLLKQLLDSAWMKEIRTRPDGPRLLARILANRGGELSRDLNMVHQHRVPLFSLSAALAQPDTYRGQFVVMRAKVSDLKNANQAVSVRLTEFGLGSYAYDKEVGPRSQYSSNSSYGGSSASSGSVAGSYNSTNYGSGTGSAAYQGGSSYSSGGNTSSSYGVTERNFDNSTAPTGLAAIGRLAKVDPFLVPDKEFVVFGKFDGVRQSDVGNRQAAAVGLLNVLEYFEPNPLVTY